MIGEIRDFETAQIAIQASLTGHLVLATVHTNDAPSTVTRLIDMGSSPSCSAPACWACWGSGWCGGCARSAGARMPMATGIRWAARVQPHRLQGPHRPVRADGGRRPCAPDDPQPRRRGRCAGRRIAGGLRSMREDGDRLVAAGITSLEEVLRVTRD